MEYTALYREWRPNTFDEIVGQDTIVKTLKNQIKGERIGHAYLFCGPRGTGKTSTAKIFARAVNCLQPDDANPCGVCSVCTQTMDGNTMDIIEIDAASNNGVDEIRDLRDKAKFPPAIGRYKVYIIDEVHMLSTGAFNALLKTLEEPPSHIIFILATTEPHKLPATIISRCQRYDFKLIELRTIVEQLRHIASNIGVEVEEEALYTIARWSEGGMRDALSLLDQCIGFCDNVVSNSDVLEILGTADEHFMFQMVDFVLRGDVAGALEGINRLIEDGVDISVFVKDIIVHLRALLIIKTCRENFADLIDASPATIEAYGEQAKRAGEKRLFRAIELFASLESELKWSNQPRVLLELTITRICRPEEEYDNDAILDRLETLEQKIYNIENGAYVPPVEEIKSKDKLSSINKKESLDDISVDVKSSADKEDIETPTTQIEETIPFSKAGTKKIKSKPKTQKVEKDVHESKEEEKAKDVSKSSVDIAKMWPQIMKVIKKERVAIYSLLIEAQCVYKGGNIVTLIFPPDQGFFVAAVEKDSNREFIESIIKKVTGSDIDIRCCLEGEDVGSSFESEQEDEEDAIVQKAIEIFGKDRIEIVDGEEEK